MIDKTGKDNPFSITKASHFTDSEINKNWVDISKGKGFYELLKPKLPMPMFIIGGKGSGKTHLMRYYSISLQNLRTAGDLLSQIIKYGYFGIYIRCSGLNSSRFNGKGMEDEVWENVFSYYFELWLGQMLIEKIDKLFLTSDELREYETDFCRHIAELICCEKEVFAFNFDEIITQIGKLKNELDIAVNNAAITRKLDIQIKITRGSLIFGIPKYIKKEIGYFENNIFVYLIDELENLSESQQKYINTLVREVEPPASLKIGSRLYGVKTFATYSDGEEIREGSEYEALRLDDILRENEGIYKKFSKNLIIKRILESGFYSIGKQTIQYNHDTLEDSFEKYKTDLYFSAETAFVLSKYNGRERPYFNKPLRRYLWN